MENEELVEKVDSNNYKCPECGAPMQFDPATNKLKCDYCHKTITLKETDNTDDDELDFSKVTDEDLSWQNEKQVIRCKNCGSENIVSKKDMSLVCPFCGSSQVVAYDEIAGVKPNKVIPFNIDKKSAQDCYKKLVKRKIYAPSKVKKMHMNLHLNGIYVPSWTYDSQTFSSYSGRLGKHYTETVGSGKNRRTVTKTRYFRISGTKLLDFDDLLVNSSKSLDQTKLNKIQPFGTNESKDFDEAYLAGFAAEHYTKDVKTGFKEAKQAMKSAIERSILSEYSYDVVDYLTVSTHYDNVTYKYVLLPIWFGVFKFHEKDYGFLVNGETGKTSGNYPKSALKITFTVVGILLLVAAILLLTYFYG